MTASNFNSSSAIAADQDPLIGTVIDGVLELRRIIGTGGMGRVYEAHHRGLDTLVAVKVLHRHLLAHPGAVMRLQSEARIASSLQHPNLISINKFGCVGDDDLPYISMEKIEGISLTQLLRDSGSLTGEQFQSIFTQCATALQYAHDQGVVHRDIKPGNIMLLPTVRADLPVGPQEPQYQVKIADFGIAKALIAPTGGTLQHLTQTGELVGTPMYMSPEQCQSSDVDHRSDIYSLGCVMYEALCGHKPFDKDGPFEVMLAHAQSTPPWPVSRDSAATERFATCIMRALEKDPSQRQQSMQDLCAELTDPAASTAPVRTSKRKQQLPKRKLAVLLIASGLIGGAFIAFSIMTANREVEIDPSMDIDTTNKLLKAINYYRQDESKKRDSRAWRSINKAAEQFFNAENFLPVDAVRELENEANELECNEATGAELEIAATIRLNFAKAYEHAVEFNITLPKRSPRKGAIKEYRLAISDLKRMIGIDPLSFCQFVGELDRAKMHLANFEQKYAAAAEH